MTGRWITVSLLALALAGCNKKEADKPSPPKTETPAPPPTTPPTSVTPPVTAPVPTEPVPGAEVPAYEPAPPPPGVTPTTTPDAPPTFLPAKPLRPTPRPPVKVIAVKPDPKIVKVKAQAKAERDVLGLWIEQKRRNSILNFTADGKVTYVDKITDKPIWRGEWKADKNGVVRFALAKDGATGSFALSAYPTSANVMAVIPIWGKDLPGSGRYAYERMR